MKKVLKDFLKYVKALIVYVCDLFGWYEHKDYTHFMKEDRKNMHEDIKHFKKYINAQRNKHE